MVMYGSWEIGNPMTLESDKISREEIYNNYVYKICPNINDTFFICFKFNDMFTIIYNFIKK